MSESAIRPTFKPTSVFGAILKRELRLAYRHRNDLANPLVFFVIVITLFPLGVSPESSFLAELAPGVIWVAALLASMLFMDRLFRDDYEDGSLEQMLVSSQSLLTIVLAKVVSHWLVSGVPLALLAPLLGVMLFLPQQAMLALFVSLLMGSLILSFIGAIGAALTVGLRKGGLLLSLIILPLFIPVLIFGAGAVTAAAQGMAFSGQLAILGALLSLTMVLSPFAIIAALKISATN